MKQLTYTVISFLFFSIITFAQGQVFKTTQDNLPEGAVARLGNGTIMGNIVLSPDDSTIAIPSSVGIWLYDTRTFQQLSLLTEHTGIVTTVEFSLAGDILASGGEDTTVKIWHTDSGKYLKTLEGHVGAITKILFSPVDEILATGSKDDTIRIWDLTTNQTIAILRGHTTGVDSMAFSSDGNLIASAALGESYVWDISTGKRLYTLPQGIESKTSIALSSDGNTLITMNNPIDFQYHNAIRIWDTENPESNTLFESKYGSSDITGIVISPDGRFVSAIVGGKIQLWELKTRMKLPSDILGNKEMVKILFSPDGRKLLSSDKSNRIHLWDCSQGWLESIDDVSIQSKSNINDLFFNKDGSYFISRNQEGIQFWDVKNGELTGTIPLFEAKWRIDFSPDGKNIVNWDYKKIHLINITNENYDMSRIDLDIPSSYINSVMYSPDGSSLLVWGSGKYLELWDTKTGIIKVKLQEYIKDYATFAFSPNGQTLASGSRDGEIVMWNLESGEIKRKIKTDSGRVGFVKFSLDGETIASWSHTKKIQLWDSDTGELTHNLDLDMKPNIQPLLKFLPDERTLAYSPDSDTIQFWDIESREPLHHIHINNAYNAILSPDGKVIARVNFETKKLISIWDVGKRIQLGKLNTENSIWFPIIFTHDGRKLIHRTEENNILVWDIESLKLIYTFSGHVGEVNDIAVSPDGKTVASIGEENPILLWDTSK